MSVDMLILISMEPTYRPEPVLTEQAKVLLRHDHPVNYGTTNLAGANLSNADLRGVDLSGIDLHTVIIGGALF